MKRPPKQGVAVTIGLVGLCLCYLPIARAASFFAYTSRTHGEDGSINSYNDYSYARALLFACIFAFLVSAGMVWLLKRTKAILLLIHIAFSWLGALLLTVSHPETVIVLIPPVSPWLLVAGYTVLGLIALTTAITNNFECESLLKRIG